MLKGMSWVAVLAAIVLLEILGFIWYGPLFGDRWMAAMEGLPQSGGMATTLTLGVVNTLIVVVGLNWLLHRLGPVSLGGAVGAALAAWFFFDFTTMAVDYLYLGHSLELVAINMGYQLVAYLTAGAVIGVAVRRGAGLAARRAA